MKSELCCDGFHCTLKVLCSLHESFLHPKEQYLAMISVPYSTMEIFEHYFSGCPFYEELE